MTSVSPVRGSPTAELEAKVIIALAGQRAVKRALSRHSPGWVRHLAADEETALHEAGHIIAAWAFGRTIYFASIRPPDVKTGHRVKGFIHYGRQPSSSTDPDCWSERETDRREAVRLAYALTPAPAHWRAIRATLRRLQERCDELIVEHWGHACVLADALQRQGTLDQQQIEAMVRPRQPA
jgi:hypothetical protein